MQTDTNLNKCVELKNVEKVYPTGEVGLRSVSLSVSTGEFLSIIGPSGCGKTTLLNIIAGLEEATAGTVRKPDDVSMVFQSGALLPWLSVFDNIALGLVSRSVKEKNIKQEVEKQAATMSLEGLLNKMPRELSGGERQRVGIARALAVSPPLLLLDEPFSALDISTSMELHRDLLTAWRERQMSVVLVSHLVEEAVSLSERVLLMKEGMIEKEFPIDLSYPRRDEQAPFIALVERIRHSFLKEE